MTDLLAAAELAEVRTELGLAAESPVRLLTSSAADITACTRMHDFAEQRARSIGGTISGSNPVYYAVGNRYVAVIADDHVLPTAPAGSATVRFGHVPVYVFDSGFQLVGSIAM